MADKDVPIRENEDGSVSAKVEENKRSGKRQLGTN